MLEDTQLKVDRLAAVTVHLMESARLNCGRVLYADIERAVDGWLAERARILNELQAMGICLALPDSVYRQRLLPSVLNG